ncbi:hypothetical protein HOG21_02105 [bacterium]|nr:hypothetical protein [bacterium]
MSEIRILRLSAPFIKSLFLSKLSNKYVHLLNSQLLYLALITFITSSSNDFKSDT